MKYEVLVTTGAQRDLKRLPPQARERLMTKVLALETQPRRSAEKLAGTDSWRIRIGDYRVVFRVDDRRREVLIARVRHRRDVYRR